MPDWTDYDLRNLMVPDRRDPPDLPEEEDFTQAELDGAIADILRRGKYALVEMLDGPIDKGMDDLTTAQIRGAAICALENETPVNAAALGYLVLKRLRLCMDEEAQGELRDE